MNGSEASNFSWWLSLEPLGDDAAWALTRAHRDRPPTGPVDAGLITGLGELRRLVEAGRVSRGDRPETRPWAGPLADPNREPDLAIRLGRALLPGVLRAALRGVDRQRPDTVTVAVRGWLATVPWDCLAVDARGDVRLVEVARVLGGLPATLHVGRARLPTPATDGRAIRIIDPGPSGFAEQAGHGNGSTALAKLYPTGTPAEWFDRCRDDEIIEPTSPGDFFSHTDLGDRLTSGQPARLLYLGHALAGTADAPARAALLLSDEVGQADRFTAFQWLREPAGYPAPARVAVIGCGSDDSAEGEQSGLPIAAINAGAEVVTATRWILPADPSATERATTELALAVDDAHASTDPVGALRTWQCQRLQAWRQHGRRADAPLLWASLVTYLAPGRR